MDAVKQVAKSYEISTKVAQLYQKRTKVAQQHFGDRLAKAYADCAADLGEKPVAPMQAWSHWYEYATDFAQRWLLFWDVMRAGGQQLRRA